jgi:hypothetical protein
MGLFTPSKKFDRMPTPEQAYLTGEGRARALAAAERYRGADAARAANLREAEAVEARRETARRRVTRVGTLTRTGPRDWAAEGWEITGVPRANGRYTDGIGGVPLGVLCELAHGPRCRCTEEQR